MRKEPIMSPQQAMSQSQQNQALGLSTFAFTICFAVWTIFAIIGIEIKQELGLNDTQFGLLVGTPILTGSLVRLLLGVWTDQYGGRIVFALTMEIGRAHVCTPVTNSAPVCPLPL